MKQECSAIKLKKKFASYPQLVYLQLNKNRKVNISSVC